MYNGCGGGQLVCTPAVRSQCIKRHRQASPLCFAPEGPCGCFPVGWEQDSPGPAHPRTLGRWPRSVGVGSTGLLLPTGLRDRGTLTLSWQPMKLARHSSLSHRFTHKGLFNVLVLLSSEDRPAQCQSGWTIPLLYSQLAGTVPLQQGLTCRTGMVLRGKRMGLRAKSPVFL